MRRQGATSGRTLKNILEETRRYLVIRASGAKVGERYTQDQIGPEGYRETSRWADVHKAAVVGAVAVVFNFKINCLVQIKHFGQKHEHVNEPT